MNKKAIELWLLLCTVALLPAALWAANEKPHAVIVVGTVMYSPELTMPLFAEELERFRFEVTVVQGTPNREKMNRYNRPAIEALPGIDALAKADVSIFYCQIMTLADKEFGYIHDYITSGKPVVGLRTSTFSFDYPQGHKYAAWNYGFGRRVLGTPWMAHTNAGTDLKVIEEFADHPVLSRIDKKSFSTEGNLYLTRLEPGAIPLILGIGKDDGREHKVIMRESGTFVRTGQVTDIFAWAWENEWGAKVFGTTLGHQSDFADKTIVRILLNGVCWAVDHPLPPADSRINTWEVDLDLEIMGKPR